MPKQVIPLESNPQIFTQLSQKLGLSPLLQFHDIYSLDPEQSSYIPQPTYAIILLFPLSESQSHDPEHTIPPGKQVEWFKQTIGNACGLYALLHVLSNIPADLIVQNSIMSEFIKKVEELGPGHRIRLAEELEESINLDEEYGSQGQTEAPSAEEEVSLHFVTFIKGRDGHLYELDGRKEGPVDLGEGEEEDGDRKGLIGDERLRKRVEWYMNNVDLENMYNFAMMGIAPTLD